MTGGIALPCAVQDGDRFTQGRGDVITQRRHTPVATRGCVVEEDGLLNRTLIRPALAYSDPDFLLLNTETAAKGASQGDANRQGPPRPRTVRQVAVRRHP